MPESMDLHRNMKGITADQLLGAHQRDLENQDEENANFIKAWPDPDSGMVFCLSEAPSAQAVQRVQEKSGHPADEIYPVPVQA